jgi:hypothetical protein
MNEYDLGFSDIYGAGTGNVQGAQDIMGFLFDLLKKSERKEFEGLNFMDESQLGGWTQDRGYDLQDWESYLGDVGNPETTGYDQDTEAGQWATKRASTLLSMLKGSGVMDLTQGYGRDMGDISSEFGAQLQGLQKGYTTKGKGGRYGKIGTSGRNIGLGGRSKYLSDIYGLQQKQHEMQQGLQDQLSDDFYDNIARWQGQYPSSV